MNNIHEVSWRYNLRNVKAMFRPDSEKCTALLLIQLKTWRTVSRSTLWRQLCLPDEFLLPTGRGRTSLCRPRDLDRPGNEPRDSCMLVLVLVLWLRQKATVGRKGLFAFQFQVIGHYWAEAKAGIAAVVESREHTLVCRFFNGYQLMFDPPDEAAQMVTPYNKGANSTAYNCRYYTAIFTPEQAVGRSGGPAGHLGQYAPLPCAVITV